MSNSSEGALSSESMHKAIYLNDWVLELSGMWTWKHSKWYYAVILLCKLKNDLYMWHFLILDTCSRILI